MGTKLESLKRVAFVPPPYTRGSVAANRLGLQPCRVVYESVRRALVPEPRELPEGLEDAGRVLRDDGVVAIPDFLSSEAFEAVSEAAEQWHRSPEISFNPGHAGPAHRDHHQLDWVQGVVEPVPDAPAFAAPMFDLFASDPRIEVLVKTVMGAGRIWQRPQVVYEHLRLPDGNNDDTDNLLVMHADRHFPTAKVFLALASNGPESGPFEYCIGSHRLSLERLRFEREYAVNCANFRDGHLGRVPAEANQNGRVGITPEQWRRLGLSPTPIVAEPNTLIVANNRGFHRRGVMSAGHSRVQLRLIYHGLREPVTAPVVRAASRAVCR